MTLPYPFVENPFKYGKEYAIDRESSHHSSDEILDPFATS